MFGIIGGMLRTLEHFVRPRPVTRKYPYEKRVLPERSRGLIALLLEPETSIFKCESCLVCEKACPPRAISISYTFRNSFRRRPLLAPRANYYRIRMVAAAPYGDRRPLSTAVTTIPAEDEAKLDLQKARAVLEREKEGADRMTRVLYGIQQAYGYLPWTAAELVAIEFGNTMTDVYTVASLLSSFRGAPEGEGTAVPRGGYQRGGQRNRRRLERVRVGPRQHPRARAARADRGARRARHRARDGHHRRVARVPLSASGGDRRTQRGRKRPRRPRLHRDRARTGRLHGR